MGRAHCCDKANVKKGPWSPEEDAKLKSYIDLHGTGGNWIALPQKIGLKRCGKSCRLRWLNYLRPNLKHGGFSEEEDNIIWSLYISIGSRWSIIANQLPGRTDNDIKNYWNTKLKNKLLGKQRKDKHPGKKGSSTSTSTINSTSIPSSTTKNLQNPYWPELPPVLAPYNSNQNQTPHPHPPGLNDHIAIRKLLIKLGGKFSDELVPQDHQVSSRLSITSYSRPSPQFHDQPNIGNVSSSSASMVGFESVTNNTNINGEGNCYTVHFSGFEELQGFDGNIVNPQKLDGFEFLMGEDIEVNAASRIIDEGYSGTLCSMLYPPSVSSSEEGLIHYQGCDFERELMRYPGSIK